MKRLFWPLAGAATFIAALFVIRNEMAGYSVAGIRTAMADVAPMAVALAILFTVLDYVALCCYDLLGLRYAGQRLPVRKVAIASTTGYAFSQALGFPLVTGTPIRYRLYSGWGLEAEDVARSVAFCTVTFWLGFLTFGGVVFFLSPMELPADTGWSLPSTRPVALIMLALAGAYLVWCWRQPTPLRFRGAVLHAPDFRTAVTQVAVGCAEWVLSAAVLWALLPARLELGFVEAMGLYATAQVVGLVSHVPGGVGVFEAVVLAYTATAASDTDVVGALVLYRFIFYLLPLMLGAALLLAHELRRSRREAVELAQSTVSVVSSLTPRVSAALSFVTGAVLILGGTLPIAADTRRWISGAVPLPLFELSHFAASIVGASLLILARGLQRRLDGAWHVTVVALSVTIIMSLARGPDAAESLLGLLLLGLLIASKREFYRETSLLRESFSPGWVVSIALVLATSVWLGMFAYSRVEYSNELWWSFTAGGNAPRFLRSSVGVAAVLGLFALARLLRPAPVRPEAPSAETLAHVRTLVGAADRVSAHLATIGDKQFLLSESGRSFIMYSVAGDSWVAMGDPVGDPEEFRPLVWRFRNLADLAGDAPVFYQVGPEYLSLYLDAGLRLLKIGEEGFVETDDFTLDGPRRADFRKAVRRLEGSGASFEIVPVDDLPPLIPELQRVSDAWLEQWGASEKGFSLGAFSPGYLVRNPIAVVRVGDRVMAFGNVWQVGHHEVSFDLMRYLPDAPKSTMDFMFTRLILWAKEEGIARVALGMAPLSGLETGALAPAWDRFGSAVFRHGGSLYNFEGLRNYKAKFDPVWEPRYLGAPAGVKLPGTLADVTTLISGGVRGLIRR